MAEDKKTETKAKKVEAKEPVLGIDDKKKAEVLKKLAKAESIEDIKSAVTGLKPAERNALARELQEAMDKVVKATIGL